MGVRHFTSDDVTYLHWMDAQTKSQHAHLLDAYHAVST